MDKELKAKLPPLAMGAAIIAADQISKALIVSISKGKQGRLASYLGDFLWIMHQRNTGAAFSFLAGMGPAGRFIGLAIVPLVALVGITVWYFRSKELSALQRWALAAAVAGGFGNLNDRFFRFPLGVVDFISTKFPGPWGDRWPTYNVADASLTIGCSLLILSFLIQSIKEGRKPKEPAATDGGAAGA